MTAEEFVFWLSGFFTNELLHGDVSVGLSSLSTNAIKDALKTVRPNHVIYAARVSNE